MLWEEIKIWLKLLPIPVGFMLALLGLLYLVLSRTPIGCGYNGG